MKFSDWMNSQKIYVFVPEMVWSLFGAHPEPD